MSKADCQDIAQAVLSLIDAGRSVEQVSTALAHYLTQQRTTRELDKIMREVERLRRERDGIVEVVATSARPISAEIEREIARLFGPGHVNITKRKDESLVGGVRLNTLDAQADLSVRGRLTALRNGLKG